MTTLVLAPQAMEQEAECIGMSDSSEHPAVQMEDKEENISEKKQSKTCDPHTGHSEMTESPPISEASGSQLGDVNSVHSRVADSEQKHSEDDHCIEHRSNVTDPAGEQGESNDSKVDSDMEALPAGGSQNSHPSREESSNDIDRSTPRQDGVVVSFACTFSRNKSIEQDTFQEHLEQHSQAEKGLDGKVPSPGLQQEKTPVGINNESTSKICDEKSSDNLTSNAHDHNVIQSNHNSDSSSPSKNCQANSTEITTETHVCNLCKCEFSDSTVLQAHKCDKPDAKGTECDSKSAPTNEGVDELPEDVTGGCVCKFCGEKFADSSGLEVHQQGHDPQKPYQCFHCKRCFKFQSQLKCHILSHSSGRPHQCKTCGANYKYSRHLREHEKLHTEDKALKCEVCWKLFSKPSSLRKHMIVHTEERPNQCSFCGKTFKTPHNLQEHERIHTGEKRYKCQYCQERFVHWTHMRSHESREHPTDGMSAGETPYQCKICQKFLSSSGNLGRHVRAVHKGERPYVCRYCDKAFKGSNHLKVHEMIHSGERPHPCEECGKAFIASGDLERHMRIHNDERPYRCQYCERAFRQHGSLTGHLRRKHILELVMGRCLPSS